MKRWPTKPLGDLCDVRIGRTPPRDKPQFWGGNAVWITIRDLNGGDVTASREMLSDAAVRECMPEPVPAGTLLFSFKLSIGKMAVTGCPLYTNEAIAALPIRKPAELSRAFLRYALLRESHEGTANTAVLGKVLNKEKVQQLSIPVPPMQEQECIVRLLDEADELRKLRGQADRRTAKFIPALLDEMFGNSDLPEAPLGEIAKVVSGVAKGRRFNGQKPVSVPYVRVANVQDGYLDLSELKMIEALPGEVEELSLKKGDVLMTEGGDYNKLGRGAMLEQDLPNCIHQNHVFRVRCDREKLLPEYFAKFLLTQPARHYFLRCAKKTSNLASINMSQLRVLPVPVPSLMLQKEFVKQVTSTRELETSQAASQQRLEELFQSLLHRAFNGEL